mgnify:CR=1 FL=1
MLVGKVLIPLHQIVFMKAGSIASNPNKLRIMNLLVKKELNVDRIVKSTRLPPNLIKGLIEELLKEGFIEEKEGFYFATDEGKKALKTLKV